MITIDKIETYKRFRGDIDGFARSGKRDSEISDEEWRLIGEFLSALHIIRTGMASPEFAQAIEQRLLTHLADDDSREELHELSKTGFD